MNFFTMIYVCFLFSINVSGTSIDGNSIGDGERKFRSGKVHQLWQKAQRMELSSVTLADLYLELKQHDHDLMELKVLRSQGEDSDGLKQAKLQKEFNGILFKFGFTENKPQDRETEIKAQVKNKDPFLNRKLNWLWKEAQQNGRFSKTEMDKLFLEFKHHEDKLTELKALQADLQEKESNSIELDKDDKSLKDSYSKMEALAEEVNDDYQRIHILAKKNKDKSLPFVEPRVLELWYMMKEGNFTDDEKMSLEEELRHFENRIEKHRHFRGELRNVAEKVAFHGGKDRAPVSHLNKHEKLRSKVQDLADKMHKAFINLKSRLSVGVVKHNEL